MLRSLWASRPYAVAVILALGIGTICFIAVSRSGDESSAISAPDLTQNDGITAADEKTAVVFVPPTLRFENVKDTFQHTFHFENRSTSTITVQDIKPSCRCMMTKPAKKTYHPGEAGTIPIVIDLAQKPPGAERFSIAITYEDERRRIEQARTEFLVNHRPDILATPNPVQMHSTPGEHPTAQIVVMDYHTKAMKINEPLVSSSWIKVVAVERPTVYLPGWRHVFEVSLSGDGPGVGNYREEILLNTDDPNHPEIRIAVLLTVAPRIRVAPNPLYLKRSDKGAFIGKLYVSDAQGKQVELEGMDRPTAAHLHR